MTNVVLQMKIDTETCFKNQTFINITKIYILYLTTYL